MKVLLLLHDYLPEHVGGTEVHAHGLARDLRRAGHDVVALFSERRHGADTARDGELSAGELDGVRTIEAAHAREYADVRASWTEPRALATFRRVLASERPDVVHVHHLATWGPAVLGAARELGCAVVLTLHDLHAFCDGARGVRRDGSLCRPWEPGGPCGDCLARYPGVGVGAGEPAQPNAPAAGHAEPAAGHAELAAGHAELAALAAERLAHARPHLGAVDRVLCPSKFFATVAAESELFHPARIDYLPSAVPGERAPPRTPPADGALRVGFLGGLYPDKGAHVLVDAIARCAEPVELVLHGETAWFPGYVDGLRERARGLPVTLAGRYAPDAIDALLDALDLVAAPSLWEENRPLVVLDAFRRGLPVAASALGGLAELVGESGAGWLVPAGDAAALAEVLDAAARDRAELARRARLRPALPEPADVLAETVRIYERALARTR